jgi:hypothetical protein
MLLGLGMLVSPCSSPVAPLCLPSSCLPAPLPLQVRAPAGLPGGLGAWDVGLLCQLLVRVAVCLSVFCLSGCQAASVRCVAALQFVLRCPAFCADVLSCCVLLWGTCRA